MRLKLFWLFVCFVIGAALFMGIVWIAKSEAAPVPTPALPTLTPMPVPANYSIRSMSGVVVVPVVVTDATTDDEDNLLMVKFQTELDKSGRAYLLLKCYQQPGTNYLECAGYLNPK